MNDLRDFALEKAVKKVKECMKEFVGGVYLSQITSYASINNDMARRALVVIGAHEDDAAQWHLSDVSIEHPKNDIKPSDLKDLPKELISQLSKETKSMAEVSKPSVSLAQRIKDLLEQNKEGLTLAMFTSQLNCKRESFDTALWKIRKSGFAVSLIDAPDGTRRYVYENHLTAPDTQPVPKEAESVVEKDVQVKPKLEEALQPSAIMPDVDFVHKPVVAVSNTSSLLDDIKNQAVVTQTLKITREQIESVLKDAFGYDDLGWNFKHGLTGATLTKKVKVNH